VNHLEIPLDPELAAGDAVALLGVEVAARLRLLHDERQLHHAAVDGHGTIEMPHVPELPKLVRHEHGVVLDQPADVPQGEPHVAL